MTDELRTTATELVDLVQAKVGTTSFTTAYNRIRQSALNIRQERRVARATQVRSNVTRDTHANCSNPCG